jgi:sulfate adenylyltransferase subunit 1 (EFTu-like GTPase family)
MKLTVRRIAAWPKKECSHAAAGQNIGVMFAPDSVPGRGTILADAREDVPLCAQAQASVFWIEERPWPCDEPLTIRCATQTRQAVLQHLSQRYDTGLGRAPEDSECALRQHEIGEVSLRFSEPLVLEHLAGIPALARFTLERDGQICGIGVIP